MTTRCRMQRAGLAASTSVPSSHTASSWTNRGSSSQGRPLGTFWDFDSLSRLAPGAAGHNDMRLKAEAGVTIGATDGTKLQAGGAVEEGEPGAANVWSGRLQLSVPMK